MAGRSSGDFEKGVGFTVIYTGQAARQPMDSNLEPNPDSSRV